MSAILSADALNDFISPGVACIKPVETLPPQQPPPDPTADPNEVILDGQQQQQQRAAPATISLTDCLACSGCVTSAEAVLVSLQSHAEVLSVLDAAPALRVRRDGGEFAIVEGGAGKRQSCNGAGGGGPSCTCSGGGDDEHKDRGMLLVASVAPQVRASLAAACGPGTGARQAGYMLEQLLRGPDGLAAGGKWGNRFAYVVDTNVAREACLVLGADEVLSPANSQNTTAPIQRPILTSSCPGWVCYAEKTHPHVLPHLSRVKSPQALTGTLFKSVLSRRLGIPPSRIWHLAIMPCFDKKLEASREELTDAVWDGEGGDGRPGRGVRDVDCVITSKEILMLAESRGLDFFRLSRLPPPPSPTDSPFPDPVLAPFLFPSRLTPQPTPDAGPSGGNLYFILQTVASRNPGSQIQTVQGRNADVVEYNVTSASGEVLMRAARYYGFRNIQNLVRKLKPPRPSRVLAGKMVGTRRPAGKASSGLDYAYVEVMACPGGCTNGGGQIKVDDAVVVARRRFAEKPGPQEQKEWLAAVDEAYFSADESEASGEPNGVGDAALADALGGVSPLTVRGALEYWSRSTGIDLDRLALTTFREVVSDVGKDATMTDTEKAAQFAGKIGGGW